VAQNFYRHDVIYLHQQPYLFDSSVWNNIAYGLKRAGVAKAEVDSRVEQALEWAGLGTLAARNARKLSGGEQQRVALTRAWVLSPRVLLLDEPLASMDHESRERSYFLIQRLKTEGIGVVIASHEFERLTAVADAHLRLDAGTLCAVSLRTPKRTPEAAPVHVDRPGAAGV
jgi:tungstate transport system ATP-binding protein